MKDKFTSATQTKTIADAYEAFNGVYPKSFELSNGIGWWLNQNGELCWNEWIPHFVKLTVVCNRFEFENYAKEQGKVVTYTPHFKATRENLEKIAAAAEDVRWTHLVNGSECVLLDESKDCDGYYIVKTHYGAFELAKEHDLKPIKPRLTKAEAWDKAVLTGDMCHIIHIYEIID